MHADQSHSGGLTDFLRSLIVQSGPSGDEHLEYFVWHLRIVRRVATPAGFELGSGMAVNPSCPEAPRPWCVRSLSNGTLPCSSLPHMQPSDATTSVTSLVGISSSGRLAAAHVAVPIQPSLITRTWRCVRQSETRYPRAGRS